MNDPMVLATWPLVADLDDDFVTATGSLPDDPLRYGMLTGDDDEGLKRRAACEECRKRKLRCSGDPTGCARCVKQKLTCHYSHQKQMGRPRKKRKLSDDDNQHTNSISETYLLSSLQQNPPNTPDQAIRGQDRYTVPGSLLYSQHMNTHQLATSALLPTEDRSWEPQAGQNHNNDSDATPPSDSPPTPYLSYPTSKAKWPDYSTTSQLPQMVADDHLAQSGASASISDASFEGINTLPSVPACPCLPNLYLALSTLATVSTFPVSNNTIESLQNATRTASAVLYCAVCPQNFQSGMQNVMLLGTLMTVLADGWNRVRLAPAAELKEGFSTARPGQGAPSIPLSPQESLAWRRFSHTLVRAYVFGDANPSTTFTLPDGSSSISSCPFECPNGIPLTLSVVVRGMERRQKTWHEMHEDTGEFPPPMSVSDFRRHVVHMGMIREHDMDLEQHQHLCLNIVNSTVLALRGLDHPPPTCADVGLKGHEQGEECQICDSVIGS